MSRKVVRPLTPSYRDERWRQYEKEQERKRRYNMLLGGFAAGVFALVLLVIGLLVIPHNWRRQAGSQVDGGLMKVEQGIEKLR